MSNAILAYRRGDYASIWRTAVVFNIPASTLQDRLKNRKSRIELKESQLLLTLVEEQSFKDWIVRASRLANPIGLPLLIELASEIVKN